MLYSLRNSLPLAIIFVMIPCGLVFADTVYLKNGEKIEKATITEVTQTDIKYKIGERAVVYTISKSDAIKIVYNDGSEDVFSFEPQAKTQKDSVVKRTILLNSGYLRGLEISYVQEAAKNFKYSENDYIFRYGLGYGIYGLLGDFLSTPIFFNAHLGSQKGDFEYFFNNRLGINVYGDYDKCIGMCDIFYEPSVGLQFNSFNLSLGYNFSSHFENNFLIRAGFRGSYKTKVKDDSSDAPKENSSKENNSRYFRPGIELNYPVYRSEIEFFDNSFPYLAGGAGLFFRIGPEYFYLTTGAYAKLDVLHKEGIARAEFGVLGINLVSAPLLDLEWSRLFVEVPFLLSFGSGQIRFTGGVSLDFYALSEVNVNVNEKVPIIGGQNVISTNDAKRIEERFNELPNGNLYTVLGLDIDIMRHWGIGVKCLIWSAYLGEDSDNDIDVYMGVKPSLIQTRVSTYFVF